MNGRTRASRVATAGSQNVALQADTELSATATPNFQAFIVARRFGLSPAVAATVAALAFATPETWKSAR